LFYHHNELI